MILIYFLVYVDYRLLQIIHNKKQALHLTLLHCLHSPLSSIISPEIHYYHFKTFNWEKGNIQRTLIPVVFGFV